MPDAFEPLHVGVVRASFTARYFEPLAGYSRLLSTAALVCRVWYSVAQSRRETMAVVHTVVGTYAFLERVKARPDRPFICVAVGPRVPNGPNLRELIELCADSLQTLILLSPGLGQGFRLPVLLRLETIIAHTDNYSLKLIVNSAPNVAQLAFCCRGENWPRPFALSYAKHVRLDDLAWVRDYTLRDLVQSSVSTLDIILQDPFATNPFRANRVGTTLQQLLDSVASAAADPAFGPNLEHLILTVVTALGSPAHLQIGGSVYGVTLSQLRTACDARHIRFRLVERFDAVAGRKDY